MSSDTFKLTQDGLLFLLRMSFRWLALVFPCSWQPHRILKPVLCACADSERVVGTSFEQDKALLLC